jgi:hypothetical protein
MKTITVLPNQSLLDIAVQHTGSVYNTFAIAAANNIAITDDLITGSLLVIPDTVQEDKFVMNEYLLKSIEPATGITDPSVIPPEKGIGWMQIGNSFKVS